MRIKPLAFRTHDSFHGRLLPPDQPRDAGDTAPLRPGPYACAPNAAVDPREADRAEGEEG